MALKVFLEKFGYLVDVVKVPSTDEMPPVEQEWTIDRPRNVKPRHMSAVDENRVEDLINGESLYLGGEALVPTPFKLHKLIPHEPNLSIYTMGVPGIAECVVRIAAYGDGLYGSLKKGKAIARGSVGAPLYFPCYLENETGKDHYASSVSSTVSAALKQKGIDIADENV